MAITSISRDWGTSPSIVRVTTTDNFAAITAAGYITAQSDNINAIQHGDFEWVEGDLVAIVYDGGEDLFTRDAVNNTFVLDVIPPGALPLTNAHIFVGNAANVAADVAMTGDVAITNAGVTTIQPGSIDLAMLSAGITPVAVIKFAAQHTTVGGAAAEVIAVAGAVAATDRAYVQLVNDGTNNVDVVTAVVTNNTLTVTFTGDPGNDAIINYQIIRSAA